MLDTKGTFDDLVHRYARTTDQAESIQANRLYQNLAGALSGTQEYMAMEKLLRAGRVRGVRCGGRRHAADPQCARICSMPPGASPGFWRTASSGPCSLPTRMSLRAIGVATQALLRTISKVAGAEIVEDAVGFFQAFEGMEEGFRHPGRRRAELLADPATAYVLVTSARPDAVAEASFFAEKLAERDVVPAALVVNRIHPHFGRMAIPAHRSRRGRRRPAGCARGQPVRAQPGVRAGGGLLRRPGRPPVPGARRSHPPLRPGRA